VSKNQIELNNQKEVGVWSMKLCMCMCKVEIQSYLATSFESIHTIGIDFQSTSKVFDSLKNQKDEEKKSERDPNNEKMKRGKRLID
jgi:hypothetical protein